MNLPRLTRQQQRIAKTLAQALLPLFTPAIVFWATSGHTFAWRLLVAGLAWSSGVYIQLAAMHAKKPRLIWTSSGLYLIGCIFSFTVLGTVAVAFTVLYEGLVVTLLVEKDRERRTPTHILFPYMPLVMGIILSLGVLFIRLAS